MKLISYAQIQKETPYMHLGYTAAPVPDWNVRYSGASVIIVLVSLAIVLKRTGLKWFFFMLSIIAIMIFPILDSKYSTPSEVKKQRITVDSLFSLTKAAVQYESEKKTHVQKISDFLSDTGEITDGWGNRICCNAEGGYFVSAGTDGMLGNGIHDSASADNLVCEFRVFNPVIAAYFHDDNNNQRIDIGDNLEVIFEKPLSRKNAGNEIRPAMQVKDFYLSYEPQMMNTGSKIDLSHWFVYLVDEKEYNGIMRGRCVLKCNVDKSDTILPLKKLFVSGSDTGRFSDIKLFWSITPELIAVEINGAAR